MSVTENTFLITDSYASNNFPFAINQSKGGKLGRRKTENRAEQEARKMSHVEGMKKGNLLGLQFDEKFARAEEKFLVVFFSAHKVSNC